MTYGSYNSGCYVGAANSFEPFVEAMLFRVGGVLHREPDKVRNMRRKDDPELDELELDESQLDQIRKLLGHSPQEIQLMIDSLQWLLRRSRGEVEGSGSQRPLEGVEGGESKRSTKRGSWESWMDTFLENLERSGGNATVAIDLCVRCRQTVYKRRQDVPEFDRRWRQICNGEDDGQE